MVSGSAPIMTKGRKEVTNTDKMMENNRLFDDLLSRQEDKYNACVAYAAQHPATFIANISFLIQQDTHLPPEQKSAIVCATLANISDSQLKECFHWLLAKNIFGMYEIRDSIRALRSSVVKEHGYTKTMKDAVKQYFRTWDELKITKNIVESTPALQEIFDLTHPHPQRDWQVDWAQKAVYGDVQLPQDSLLAKIRSVKSVDDLLDLNIDQRVMKGFLNYFDNKFAKLGVSYEEYPEYTRFIMETLSLPMIIRNAFVSGKFSSLITPAAEKLIIKRIQTMKQLHINLGDLFLAIYYDYASPEIKQALFELALRNIKPRASELFNHLTILVDKSGSMANVVVGGVFLGLICALLAFNPQTVEVIAFNNQSEKINIHDIQSANAFCDTIKQNPAGGGTSPASAVPLISPECKNLIVISDEMENTPYDDKNFAQMLVSRELNPAIYMLSTYPLQQKMTTSLKQTGYHPYRLVIGRSLESIIHNAESILAILNKDRKTAALERTYYVDRFQEQLDINKQAIGVIEEQSKSSTFALAQAIVTLDNWLQFEDYCKTSAVHKILADIIALMAKSGVASDFIEQAKAAKGIVFDRIKEQHKFVSEADKAIIEAYIDEWNAAFSH